MNRHLLAVLQVLPASLLLFAAPRAQQRFVVDASGGAGSTHSTIQAAVNAASAGDEVLVRPVAGVTYAGFRLGIGLTVRGVGTSRVPVVGAAILDVPSGSAVVLESLQFAPGTGTSSFLLGLEVRRCRSPVVLRDVQAAGRVNLGGLTSHGAEFSDCRAVLVDHSAFLGYLGSGAVVRRSALHAQESSFVSGSLAMFFGQGGPGLFAEQSSVVLADSFLLGGHGDEGSWSGPGGCLRPPSDGAPALVAQGGRTAVLGDSTLRGGVGGLPNIGCPVGGRLGVVFQGTGIRIGPNVQQNGSPPTSTFTPVPRQPRLTGIPGVFTLGMTATARFEATVGPFVLAVAGAPEVLVLAGVEVPLLLGPGAAPIFRGAVPSTGAVDVAVVMPNVPALVGQLLYFQAGVLDLANTELRLSNPVLARVE